MLKRIVTATVLIAALVPVVIFSDTLVFPIVISLFAAVGIYEFSSCVGEKNPIVYAPLMLLAFLSPIACRLLSSAVPAFLCVLTGFLWILCTTVIFHGRENGISELGGGLIYIVCGFSMLVYLRDKMPERYLLLIIIPVCSDTFAYFVGSFIGKHKLCPVLSPKKTVEGAVGGVLGAVIGTAIFGIIMTNFVGYFNFVNWCLAAIPLSVLSMFGDLFASAVKRRHGVKDYGKLFPGHGGVMDRFDSIPPLTIAAYLFITIMRIIEAL